MLKGVYKNGGNLMTYTLNGGHLHDYAVINYETEETLTRKQIMEMVKWLT